MATPIWLPLVRTYVTSPSRPGAFGSAAIPGTTLSRAVPGIRCGIVHVTLSVELERTMSLPSQTERKLQSCHAMYSRPEASTVAVGSGGARRPRTSWALSGAIPIRGANVAPPSTERTAYSPTWLAWNTIVSAPSG